MKDNKNQESILKQTFVTQTKGFFDVSQKQDFWTEFAELTDGIFHIRTTVSKDLTLFNLIVPIENGQIEFSESDTHPLKVVCSIKSEKKLEFSITQKDFIEKFFQNFRRHDIQISQADFAKKYILKCSDESSIRTVLQEELIIHLILKTKIFSISCEREKDPLKLIIKGTIGRSVNSIEEMQHVFNLFKKIIKQIEKL